MARTILVVDDEASMVEILDYNLRKEGFDVVSARNGGEALRAFRANDVDLVVLDVMMPGMDGFEVCREIRRKSNAPIIMLTAKGTESSKVAGLGLGADDYVTKPFSLPELKARIHAALRRAGMREENEAAPGEILVRGDLELDRRKREAALRGKKVELTTLEFDLLVFLAANAGNVYSRAEILDRVWGVDADVVDRAVDVHIRHLRERIEKDPDNPKRILTVRGVGYKFVE